MTFSEFNLHPDILKGLEAAGYAEPLPVQEQTLAYTLRGRDAFVQSQTGTGKTAAFLLTIFQRFLDPATTIGKKALIIAPTRELAVQIEEEARLLGKFLPFKIGCFYGGVGYYQQEKMLAEGTDLFIGTPGRLLDFQGSHKIDFRKFGFLVIDEADRLFDMGFLPDIRRMLRAMVPYEQRQSMLFSATLSMEVRGLAWEYMNDPAEIELTPEHIVVDKITQELYHVAKRDKMSLLLGILNRDLPKNALIFTNMKHVAVMVAHQLERNGYKCQYLMGDLPQSKRLSVIDSFKDGSLSYLVATDVAARGLHIEDLEMVVNFDLPQDPENYVHRIGRTARVGKSGKAVSFACEECVYYLDPIEKYIKMKIPATFPDDSLFRADVGGAYEPVDSRRRGRSPREKTALVKAHGGSKRKATPAPGPGSARPAPADGGRRRPDRDHRKPGQPAATPGAPVAAPVPPAPPPRPAGSAATPGLARPEAKGGKPAPARKGGGRRTNEKPPQNAEERMAYYRKKYGDSFPGATIPAQKEEPRPATAQPPAKRSILKRLFSAPFGKAKK
ncbi:MAG TPA: DEAD/DEAH box helicase [Candidatus Aminicenantes bacterium]|nr:DEAD/DEAH box helicase [Candidatus Aminicenantes bacterium]